VKWILGLIALLAIGKLSPGISPPMGAIRLGVYGDRSAPPAPPAIDLPSGPPLPPAPKPPNTPTKLLANTLYVIAADPECIILTSPSGLVKVTAEKGPIKVRGQFVDGIGVETRTFTRPNVYFLDAAGTGLVELLVIPAGATLPGQVIRRNLDVDDGAQPLPPAPPTDPLTATLQAAYALETDADKAASLGQLVGLYQKSASGIVNDPGIKTYGDLYDALAIARKALMADTVLVKLRSAIGAQLVKDLPTYATTAIDRALAGKEFARVAAALGGVK